MTNNSKQSNPGLSFIQPSGLQSNPAQQRSSALPDLTLPRFGGRSSNPLPSQSDQLRQSTSTSSSGYQTIDSFVSNYSLDSAGYGGTTDTAGYGGTGEVPPPTTPRHFNQGIGNGAEGGDPGKSQPHGGSNDETGRTPGQRWIPKLFS